MLESSRRGLTPAERRLLQAKIRSLGVRGRRASTGYLPIAAGIILALWVWTLVSSDAPWFMVTGFWLVVGAAIARWVRRDARADAGRMEMDARRLASALKRNAADVYEIRAIRFAEFEEIEDEGACYAFELEGGRLAFIAGQQFYAGARFPSLGFSLVYVLDEHDDVVDMVIDKQGAKTGPAKTIPAAVKQKLEIPDHLETRIGRIDDLESVLGLPA
jgi:hypothetical protein